MQEKFLIEKIKFLTEFFKLLFAMLILLSGGLITLYAKGTLYTFDFNLLKVGISTAVILFLIIAILAVKINLYIKKLKEL